MEKQITTAPYGHILTNTGCWSRDGQWLVYDTRSDAAGSQFDGRWIERVHVPTGRVERLFESQNGAHCGVVTCCPVTERIVFIYGPESPQLDWQYAPYHRRGVILDLADITPRKPIPLDAMCYAPPLVAGALRGGSHVHVWDPLGKRLAYTYEDHLLANIDRMKGDRAESNQRNVGISDPCRSVTVPKSHERNHDGSHFSVLGTQTTDDPEPGSDQIDRAYEDAWLGGDGKRLAFLGDVVGKSGARFTELFVLELPDDLSQASDQGPVEGTLTTRPRPPRGCVQRRLTHTADRPQPGIVGPRHWPRSTPDGSQIFCLMADSGRQPQLFSVSPSDGRTLQLTKVSGGVSSAFSVSHDGQWLAFIAQTCVMLASTDGRQTRRLTEPVESDLAPRPEACVLSPDGSSVAYVRTIGGVNQVFVCEV